MHSLLLLVATFSLVNSAPDQLIFVQTLYRHGDRTPTSTYNTDPYQEEFWGVPWGELTTLGMKQQFLQGQRLRRLYVEKEQFLSPKYSRYEASLQSSKTARCIQSAAAQMAGFYSGSPTHPTDVFAWPADWTPLPIHTDTDETLDPASHCQRAIDLQDERMRRQSFKDYIASKWYLIADILRHAGGDYQSDIDAIENIWGAISIERDVYNLTLPDWITDDFYNEMAKVPDETEDYEEGGAGFGYPEDTELLRLRAGFLVKGWISNINDAIAGTKLKYHGYSSHDSLVADLLLLLHAKGKLIGSTNPAYASTVSCELWKKSDGYYVKFMYSADAYSDFVPFTRFISGCPGNDDFCSVDAFIARSQPYIPSSIDECNVR